MSAFTWDSTHNEPKTQVGRRDTARMSAEAGISRWGALVFSPRTNSPECPRQLILHVHTALQLNRPLTHIRQSSVVSCRTNPPDLRISVQFHLYKALVASRFQLIAVPSYSCCSAAANRYREQHGFSHTRTAAACLLPSPAAHPVFTSQYLTLVSPILPTVAVSSHVFEKPHLLASLSPPIFHTTTGLLQSYLPSPISLISPSALNLVSYL